MMNPDLNQALQQLQAEIDSNDEDMDDATREKLLGLKPSMQRAIDDPSHQPTLRDEMVETAAHLEAKHPTLAAALESVVNLLSRMGI